MPRFILRVVGTAGARGNSPACGGLRQSARYFPALPPMLGAGQRGTSVFGMKTSFYKTFTANKGKDWILAFVRMTPVEERFRIFGFMGGTNSKTLNL